MASAQVIIVGGGPVGMTLAYTLATYGIASTLLERHATTTTHPKMDITNARSMELFRKIGLDKKLRAVSVPEANPFDVSWITTLTGYQLHRFVYPGVGGVREKIRQTNDGSQPSEPPMRVSQVIIEPVLKQAIDEHPLVDVRFNTAFEEFTEDATGVTVTARTAEGAIETFRGEWLVGCDGGGSRVRTQLGINLSGEEHLPQRFITHFRSHDRAILQRWGAAWHYQSNKGTLVAQNDTDTWTLLSRFPEGVSPQDVDPGALIAAFAGRPVEHEILVCNGWSPHLLVADSYGRGRVLLAGDAVHQYIPTGGYGMNTGIADAFEIGWKLAAVLHGFGGEFLLPSYEAERRPVALANCVGSKRHNDVRVAIAELYTPSICDETPDGAAARATASARIAEFGNAENESVGLELGYSYLGSPTIVGDDDLVLNKDPLLYLPSTTPGGRLPSVFLADGTNLYQHLGLWFTLLCFDKIDVSVLTSAAKKIGMPLDVSFIEAAQFQNLYKGPAILVRPDHHVAWRGPAPTDSQAAEVLLRRVLGHRLQA